MKQPGLNAIFAPRSIAVVGASDQLQSVGGAVLANLIRGPFDGPVFPVNFRHQRVQGQDAYASIRGLPQVPDLAVLCTSAETIPDLVAECGTAGVHGLIIISAGFREIGAAGRLLEAKLRKNLQQFPLMRTIGPNCLGVLHPSIKLNASFSPVLPKPGRMTLLTQSGALGTAIMDWAVQRDIGFAACVSVGNMVNVGMGELIDYFTDDPETDALLLYLEGLDETAHFMAAARRCSARKPIVAFKAGRFEATSRAVASHTGALASLDSVYEAAFRRCGIERVRSIEELFDCARLLAGPNRAVGNRLAVVTNAGGPGIMATDAWIGLGGTMSTLAEPTKAILDRALPTCWSHGNPIDVLGDAPVERYEVAIASALEDPNVDGLMVIVTPQTMTEPGRIAEAVIAAQRNTNKAIVASWIGGPTVELGRDVLRASGIPVYDYPEAAANALHHLVSASQLRTASHVVEATWPDTADQVAQDRISLGHRRLAEYHGLVDQSAAMDLLAEFGIPVVTTLIACSPDDAAGQAQRCGYPVAMKVVSPEISHKTDVGGVILNLTNATAVREAYATIQQSVSHACPQARWQGVAVQPMISATRGIELLLGMTRDPLFGPVIVLGAGGITAELQRDSVLELTPFDDATWTHLLRSLRLYPLLEGYRGRPGIDLSLLRDVVRRFIQFVNAYPELTAAEINPLLATSSSMTAVDARLITKSIPDKAAPDLTLA